MTWLFVLSIKLKQVVLRCVYLLSEVYKQLVEEGEIVPRPEKRPPTVPMDYNWAQVQYFLFSAQLKQTPASRNQGLHAIQM